MCAYYQNSISLSTFGTLVWQAQSGQILYPCNIPIYSIYYRYNALHIVCYSMLRYRLHKGICLNISRWIQLFDPTSLAWSSRYGIVYPLSTIKTIVQYWLVGYSSKPERSHWLSCRSVTAQMILSHTVTCAHLCNQLRILRLMFNLYTVLFGLSPKRRGIISPCTC